jgi:hypothetical protein
MTYREAFEITGYLAGLLFAMVLILLGAIRDPHFSHGVGIACLVVGLAILGCILVRLRHECSKSQHRTHVP